MVKNISFLMSREGDQLLKIVLKGKLFKVQFTIYALLLKSPKTTYFSPSS